MTTRIGFDHYTISGRELSARETLDFARDHGLEGVQFLEPSVIDAQLDPGRLTGLRALADQMGLYLEVGLPSPSPVRRSREIGQSVSPAELAEDLGPQLDAVAALGCRYARVFIGNRHDRFRSDIPWSAQVEASREVLALLTPRLLELGVKLAIETHADFMVQELVDLLGRLDPGAFGVTLDTANLLMRLDDPVEAVETLAPWILGTHIKDAVLAFTSRGLCWQARPVGSGILPLPDILACLMKHCPAVHLTIELHPRTYDLPIFDRKWLAYFPSLRPDSLASIIQLAALCESRYTEGSLPRPDELETTPWADRQLDWLARSVGYLKSVVPALSSL
jgi:sugar phosphate isomerase/epimerase